MSWQAQQQANPDRIVDEPLTLPPNHLARVSDFWRRYDRLADIHDKKLAANLNGNLDVLLIFAALFSAINTSFISITMPKLSPDPSDETNNLLRLLVMKADNVTLTPAGLRPPFSAESNSVTVNCLLYASLTCSLLAAVGAMMAKEWLQSFDRTGQTGPIEEQAIFRQRKFDGVRQWHLEAVIKFLPNLLLLSVILFFTGVVVFLFPINTAVAGTVVAFSGLGVGISGIIIVAGAISPICPYQSAASNGLRHVSRGLVGFWRTVGRTLVRPLASKTSEAILNFWTKLRQRIPPLLDNFVSLVSRMRSWHHRSSGSGGSGDRQAVDQNPLTVPGMQVRPALRSLSASDQARSAPETTRGHPSSHGSGNEQAEVWSRSPIQLDELTPVESPASWHRVEPKQHRLKALLSRVSRYILRQKGTGTPKKLSNDELLAVQAVRWLLVTTSNRGDQISSAQFICYLSNVTCAYIFEDLDSWKRLKNLTLGAFKTWQYLPDHDHQVDAEMFGWLLCRALLQYPKEDPKWVDIKNEASQESSRFGRTFLQTLIVASSRYSPWAPEDDQRILHIAMIFTALKEGTDFKAYRWTASAPLLDGHTPAANSLLGVWANLVLGISCTTGSVEDLCDNRQELARNISWALHWSFESIQSLQGNRNSELEAAQGYIVCLQRARQLCLDIPDHRSRILSGLGDLIWSYMDPMSTSDLGAEIRLLRLSAEALITFMTFLLPHSRSFLDSLGPSGGLVSMANLVDTVVNILLDDLTSLTSQDRKWESRGRTFKACVVRLLLWIWRNHPYRDPNYRDLKLLLISSSQLWDPLEEEVQFSKRGGFDQGERPLTTDDFEAIAKFVEWTQSQRERQDIFGAQVITNSAFFSHNADVGLNRLYAHFDRHVDWKYHLYDLRGGCVTVSCSRSVYTDDGML